VILVRMHGVVPPIDAAESDAQLRDAAPPASGATPDQTGATR